MSLEETIKENTKAVHELTQAILSSGVQLSKAEAPKAEAPKAEAPKAEAPKAEAPKAEAPKAEAPKAEALPPPDVKDIVTAFRGYIAMHGNEKAAALLRRFGAGDKLLDKDTKQCTVPVERQREFFGACHD